LKRRYMWSIEYIPPFKMGLFLRLVFKAEPDPRHRRL
jgi:hypothetical protein